MAVIYTCNHEKNVPSRLSQQWLCANTCTWSHVVLLHIVLFGSLTAYIYIAYIYCIYTSMTAYLYYGHLSFLRFEHSVCRGSLMTTCIMLLGQLFEHSLVNLYQQCVAVHDMLKYISCHKAIMVITGRAHCFHDCTYILRPSCFCEITLLSTKNMDFLT